MGSFLFFWQKSSGFNHRDLAPVRAEIRKWDREERAKKHKKDEDVRRAEERDSGLHPRRRR